MNNYGQKIAEMRKGKNLTQTELGAKLNVSAQAVSKWENNLSEPDIESIRKMCEIFEISVDEFLGLPATKKASDVNNDEPLDSATPVKAILGYCEKCKKPVCAGEFTSTPLYYNPNAFSEKVKKSDTMHTYCHECYKKVLDEQQQEAKEKATQKVLFEKQEKRRSLYKGLIWGAIIFAIVSAIFLTTYFSDTENGSLLGTILICIGSFTFASQMFWDGVVCDCFFFFCRSFKAPFGFIFELSLDGILWLITVKLLLWIVFGILSILFFILGLFVSLLFSIVSFPFSIISRLKGN